MLEPVSQSRPSARRVRAFTIQRAFGFSRLIVELGVFSSLAFSLALFVAAIVQAYVSITKAFGHLGDENTTKHLMIAAVEQTDTLLVAMALLIISLGMQSLFIGGVKNVPEWLHIRTFEDLKQKLLGVVVTAIAVDFFSVALEWTGGYDVLIYGAAVAAMILSIGVYSVILSRQSERHQAGGSHQAGPDTSKHMELEQENTAK
ncbi:YqhA family protein [Deinococcus sp. QL22]|nr:YqhA family protein [Deinococcus sp. QL22]UQN07499.1 YqhA family protein [Deinococcus sp. QL22]